MTIVGIAGSLRRGSYNLMLLRAAADVMPEGVSLEIASIRDIPLYDADVEADHGLPEPVQQEEGVRGRRPFGAVQPSRPPAVVVLGRQ